jgi:MYXO-CTERM domain-containing protein
MKTKVDIRRFKSMSVIARALCCAGIVCLLAAGAQAAPLTLIGVSVYDGNDPSGSMYTGGWNTLCGGVAQLDLTGVSTCPMVPMDISSPGVYTFIYTAGNLSGAFTNLELFFNGDAFTPGIHTVIGPNSPGSLQVPTVFQYCLAYYCSPQPPGPGSLTYASGDLTVTATQFTETNPQGVWTGTIQFSVEDDSDVPEPASAGLVGLALLAVPFVLRRRARS